MKNTCASLAICFSLALLLVFVSANLQDRFQHRNQVIAEQLAYLRGDRAWFTTSGTRYVPEFQNRILFPLLLQTVSKLTVLKVSDWYLLLRLATAMLAVTVFWHLLVHCAGANLKLAAVGTGVLTIAVMFTFNFPFELPSDFLDIVFIALFIWATSSRRALTLALCAVLASANRESAMFAGLIWISVWSVDDTKRINWHAILYGALLSIVSYGLILLIRYQLGGLDGTNRQLLGGLLLGQRLVNVVTNPHPFAWPFLLFAMLVPTTIWLASNWHRIDSQEHRFLGATILIAAVTLVFGIAEELRIFVPCLVLLVFVAVAGEAKTQRYHRDHNTLPGPLTRD